MSTGRSGSRGDIPRASKAPRARRAASKPGRAARCSRRRTRAATIRAAVLASNARQAYTRASRPAGIAAPTSTAATTVRILSSGTCNQDDGAGSIPGTARAAVSFSGNHAASQASGNSAAAASGSVQPSGGGSGVADTDDSRKRPIRGGVPCKGGQHMLIGRRVGDQRHRCLGFDYHVIQTAES